jgi:hypothetical protein
MLGRLKIMQSFDGQILNLPPIFNIRIVSNINYLNEDGSVWGADRVRPLAAKASGWVSKTVRRQDPIRVAITPRFRNTVGLRGWVRLQPGAKPFAPIHERASGRIAAVTRQLMSVISRPNSAPHFPVTRFRLAAYRSRLE